MDIKHILVPVDFSDCSVNAVRVAADLVNLYNGKLFLIHSAQLPEAQVSVVGTFAPSVAPNFTVELEGAFDKLVEQVPELEDLYYEVIESRGSLVDSLFTHIQTKQIDLIVMGTRSEHDKIEKLLGTHTAEVIEASNTAVMMVPSNQRVFNPERIGFAMDGKSITNVSPLGYISSITRMFSAKLEIFFIGKEGEYIDFEKRKGRGLMDRYFHDLDVSFTNMEDPNVNQGILHFTEKNNIDLLVMIPRHHDLLHRLIKGSSTKYMAQHLKIPLLALPE
jgi:nucleotide-binding universal stress UspA family protein